MADYFVGLILEKAKEQFADLLGIPGPGDAKAGAHHPGEKQQEGGDQQQHGVVIGPWLGGVVSVKAKEANERVGRAREVVVQQSREPEFMFVHLGSTL
jgi:hypothetical protein